jgi:GT2 family glycosyltransferase
MTREFLTLIPSKNQTLARALAPEGSELICRWLSPHDRSRSFLAALALRTSYDWFLWLDDDMWQTSEPFEKGYAEADVEALFEAAKATHDCVLMSGVYVCRHAADNGSLAVNFNPYFMPGEPGMNLEFYEAGRVQRIVGCGFGFCFTHRSLFEAMDAPKAHYEDMMYAPKGTETWADGKACFLPIVDEHGNHLGEDRSFCYRVGQQGLGKMYVDTRRVAYHAGHDVKSVIAELRRAGG